MAYLFRYMEIILKRRKERDSGSDTRRTPGIRLSTALAVASICLLLAIGTAGTSAAQSTVDECIIIIGTSGDDAYELTDDVEADQDPCIQIHNSDGGEFVFDGNGHTINGSSGVGISVEPDSANVHVKNVTVSGMETAVRFDEVTGSSATNVSVYGADVGLDVYGSTTVSLTDNLVGSGSDTGVVAQESMQVVIEDNTLNPFLGTFEPIFPIDDDFTFSQSVEGTEHGHEHGVYLENVGKTSVEGNSVYSFNGSGIVLEEGADGTGVENNHISGVEGHGIVSLTSNNVLADNTVEASGERGILLDGGSFQSVINNTLRNNHGPGIQLGRFLLANNNTIVDNYAENNSIGVVISSSQDNELENNTAADNRGIGISVSGSSGNHFEDNLAEENEGSGIALLTQAGTIPTPSLNNTLVENTARVNEGADVIVEDPSNEIEDLDIGDSTAPQTTLSLQGEDVEISSVDDPADAPDGLVAVDRYFEADAASTEASLEVDLSYEPGDVGDTVDESTLEMLHHTGGSWTTVASSDVDTSENVVSAEITEFSTFGAFGEEDDADDDADDTDEDADDDTDEDADDDTDEDESEVPCPDDIDEEACEAFFDDDGNPVDDGEVIQVLLSWNDTEEVNGVPVDDGEMIQLLLTWQDAK